MARVGGAAASLGTLLALIARIGRTSLAMARNSSFGVLVYYLIANMSAYTQEPGHRRFPRACRWWVRLGAACWW